MSLGVTSGVVTAASGVQARTVNLNALPVNLFSASGNAISDLSGALNVNISGGTISVSPFGYQSGTLVGISGGNLAMSGLIVYDSGAYFSLAASGVGISHFSGALNVNISGGTISTTPPGLQSGTMVLVSGGQLALSGLFVEISGQAVTTTVNPFGYQSGTLVGISGGSVGLSGLQGVAISGSVTVLGHVVSGGVQVSGSVNITSGTIGLEVRNSGNVWTDVGYASGAVNLPIPVLQASGSAITISGGVTVSGLVGISGGGLTVSGSVQVSGTVSVYAASLQSGWAVVISGGIVGISGGGLTISGGVTVSGLVGISGGGLTISGGVTVSGSVSITSGNIFGLFYASGTGVTYATNITQAKTIVSGNTVLTVRSGLAVLQSVIPTFNSGAATASFSGQVIIVLDAVSGMSSLTSGTPVYSFDFGNHSGTIIGTPGAYPPMMIGANLVCYSGIVIHAAAGMTVTVGYA